MKLRLVSLLAVAALGACGGGEESSREVVLVTHDSFAVSKPVLRAFERETGLKVRILQSGDAGAALNRALLSAGDPEGDVFFGVDSNLLSRALGEGLFEPYESPELARVDPRYVLDEGHRVTPVDHGEVCLNVDRGWFVSRGLAPPRSFDDLTEPRYRGLLVVENPATSTPGLAFLLATIARYGEDGWRAYWRDLRASDVLVVDGWEEAYTARFSGASGSKGKRPIVVSYASSPPAEVIFAGKPLQEAPTAVVESTCFRQVEFAGILQGARNEEGAKKLVDFMLSPAFQRDIPLSMFVFPVREGVALPPAFAKWAVVPERPLELPPAEIGRNRDRWIREWTDVVLR
ncbi:MAG TPA: thiamine ABC transporter substrate-binding protein [Gaiellaceae bacterium]|nr:thiamine ABC transporter substrate-binding protein [Gaiellaceae bacterium]